MARPAAVLATVVALFTAAYFAGFLEILGDRERLGALLDELGPLGALLYVSAFACFEPFFVPGFLFVLAAATVWPFWTVYGLSLLGAVGAGIVGFGFARFLARDWVATRIPQRFRGYDEQLAGPRGLQAVVVVRLIFFLAPPAHWVLGLSQVRFTPFVFGTALGFAPTMALLCWLCVYLGEWILTQPIAVWFVAFGLVVAAIATLRLRRRASAGAAPAS
jgi:uncharacterized membrane protein YdjX (TVP38/TMEM64 family)